MWYASQWACSINTTLELARNAESRAPAQTCWVIICILIKSLDLHIHPSLSRAGISRAGVSTPGQCRETSPKSLEAMSPSRLYSTPTCTPNRGLQPGFKARRTADLPLPPGGSSNLSGGRYHRDSPCPQGAPTLKASRTSPSLVTDTSEKPTTTRRGAEGQWNYSGGSPKSEGLGSGGHATKSKGTTAEQLLCTRAWAQEKWQGPWC